jgi:pimeloyl-ACP methyl ester carboxylesterase
MKRSARFRAALAALGVLGMLAAILPPILSRLLNRDRPRFPYAVGPMTDQAYAALTSGANGAPGNGWQASRLEVAPGVTLNGIIRRPAAPADARWILFFPGNDATQLATAKKFLENVRGARDWGLAVWAYRGFSSSGGSPDSESLTSDARKIYANLIATENVPPTRVNIAAFSLGGPLAATVTGEAAAAGRPVASLSLIAAVQDIAMVHPSPFQRFVTGDVYEILPLLDAVPSPVLVMIGTKDEAIGVGQGRKIAERLGARARYIEVEGVAHNPLLDEQATFDAVRDMVERATVEASSRGAPPRR